jgi:methylated-DNA-[protein]-cysteine S-methyltransferase
MTHSQTLELSISHVKTPLADMLLACTPLGVSGLWFKDQAHFPQNAALWPPAGPHHPQRKLHDRVQSWLDAYFAKELPRFELPLDWNAWGTAFEKSVWLALLGIPWGEKISYGQLARQLKRPLAARAIGAAVGKNPLSLIVPCHRVCGAQGSLTGYAGGLDKKTYLWQLEAQPQH